MTPGASGSGWAAASGGAATLATVLTIVATAQVRLRAERRSARHRALRDAWMPFLLGVAGPPPPRPTSRDDQRAVLALWTQLRAAVRGRQAMVLSARGRAAGMDQIARRMLHGRRQDDVITAVAALGTLGGLDATPDLERLARTAPSITLRSEAARALVRLWGDSELRFVVETIESQPDWHPALVASVLDEASPGASAAALGGAASAAVRRGDVERGTRLLHAMTALPDPAGRPPVLELLSSSPPPEVASACLRTLAAIGDRADATVVREHATSETWYVRVQAAAALGTLGSADDEVLLTMLLSDPEWWVRQRAAESLTKVTGLAHDDLAVVFEGYSEVGRFAAAYSPGAEIHR